MCRFVQTKRMGTTWVCGLYRENDEAIILKGQTTVLERCKPCIEELG